MSVNSRTDFFCYMCEKIFYDNDFKSFKGSTKELS